MNSSNLDSDNLTTTTSSFKFSRSDLNSTVQSQSQSQSNSYSKLDSKLDSESTIAPNQGGGGWFCNDDFVDILLNCFQDSRPDVVCYLLCKTKKCPEDITKCDEYKRNLLHYITLYASHGNMVIHINHILKKSGKFKIKSALNCKDVAGNTPLHYATKLGFHNLVHEYIKLGADPSLRNDRGEYVLSDNGEIQSPLNPDNFDLYETPQSEIKGDLANFLNNLTVSSMHDSTFRVPVLSDEISIKKSPSCKKGNKIRAVIEPIEPSPSRIRAVSEQLEPFTIDLTSSSTPHVDTDYFLNEILQAMNENKKEKKEKTKSPNQKELESIKVENINTDDIIKNILDKVEATHTQSEREMVGGANESFDENTETIINHILNNVSSNKAVNQEGGKKKTKSGKRKVISYSEMSMGISSDASDISEIARQISRQSSDIHERSIQKIMELLKLDKNNAEDQQKARYYKASIYKTVKEQNPLLNNFDRAVEMEKQITLKNLQAIDIKKVAKEIDSYLSEKQSSNKSVNTPTEKTDKVDKKTDKKSGKAVQSRIIFSDSSELENDSGSSTTESSSSSSSSSSSTLNFDDLSEF